MRKRQLRLSFTLASGAAFAAAISPAISQQLGETSPFRRDDPRGLVTPRQPADGAALDAEGSGLTVTLGLETGLRFSDNLGLDNPSQGTTSTLENRLNLGVVSTRASDELRFDLSGVLRFSDRPVTGGDAAFEDPGATLFYARDTGNAQFRTRAAFRENALDFFRPFADINLDGIIDDSDLIADPGTRRNIELDLGLETGINDPLGFVFDVTRRDRRYSDTINPNLFDTDSTLVSLTTLLRFSPRTEGRARVSYRDYQAEDARATDRQTRTLSLGITQELSPVTTVEAEIGRSNIDETFAAIPASSEETGTTGSLNLTRDLASGNIGARIDRRFGTNGSRTTFQVSRNLELPSGSLAVRAGATRDALGDLTAVGGFEFERELSRGQFTASLSRNVNTNIESDEVRTTIARAGYLVTINTLSSMSFDFNFAETTDAGIGAATTRERGNFRAAYRRELTQDWGLSVGYEARYAKTGAQPSATDNAVFLSLNRVFTLKP